MYSENRHDSPRRSAPSTPVGCRTSRYAECQIKWFTTRRKIILQNAEKYLYKTPKNTIIELWKNTETE